MDKITYKKKVLEEAKHRQQEVIDDFRNQIKELQGSEMSTNEGQYDSGQQSINQSTNEIINKLADELNFCVEEMNLLNQLNVEDELRTAISLGSIVKTDNGDFFPSVSIEKFTVDGHELFGLSAKAPIYAEMRGKKKGETFSFNGKDYKVLEVF